jgi:hypothetical protein
MIAEKVGRAVGLSVLVSCFIFVSEGFAQQEIIVTRAGASMPADGPKTQKQAEIPTLPNLPAGQSWYLRCTANSKSGGMAAVISGFGTLCASPGKEAESLTRLVDFDSGKTITLTLQPWAGGQQPKTDLLDILVTIRVVALSDSEAHRERERLSEESKQNAAGR